MGVLRPVLDFLFGKDPDIFDEKGNVLHKLPKKKWDSWQNRLKMNPTYNWRHHTGTQAGEKRTDLKNQSSPAAAQEQKKN